MSYLQFAPLPGIAPATGTPEREAYDAAGYRIDAETGTLIIRTPPAQNGNLFHRISVPTI